MAHLPLLFLLTCTLSTALAADILVIVPVPGKSHSMLFAPLVTELAEKGHKVTYITPNGIKTPKKNIEQILIPYPKMEGDAHNFFSMRHQGILKMTFIMPLIGVVLCNHTLQSSVMQEVIHSDRHFDVIISEAFLTESVAAGLSYKFKAPLIGFGTFMPSYWVNHWVGNVAPTSFIPEPFTYLPAKMNLLQRTGNLAFSLIAKAWFNFYHFPTHDALMRQYFGEDLPNMMDIIKNTSLLLVNDHFSLSFSRPSAENLISIGGLHVKPPKPLPKDLQQYLDDSKNGAILFSLGSNLQSSLMDPEKIQVFLDAFSEIKENVVWKFEKDLPNKPRNVFISDWLPQSDILAHPNIKLFITHGGLLGTTESVDRAVPLVGIPIFGDQPMNMKHSVNAGVGLSLDFDELTADGLYKAIREVIDNPQYKMAAVQRSNQMKDRVVKPMDLAVYWIEYVIRHKGAPHLRSSGQDLSWYEEQQIDAFAIILIVLTIVFLIIKKLIQIIWRKLCSKKTTKKPKSKKN